MQTPELAADIIRSIVDAVDVPVTAKFRSGWTNEEKNAVDFAKRLEQAGASLVSVHGRSARQMYRGDADWDVIAQVKGAVQVPVAGSGDVFSYDDACRMREQCGVDARARGTWRARQPVDLHGTRTLACRARRRHARALRALPPLCRPTQGA